MDGLLIRITEMTYELLVRSPALDDVAFRTMVSKRACYNHTPASHLMMASPTYTHITTYQFDYFLLISILCELCLIVLLFQTPACLMDHHLPIIVSFVVDLGASAARSPTQAKVKEI